MLFMIMKISLALPVLAVLLGLTACAVNAEGPINSYNECIAAGNIVLRSYPGRCVTKDGRSFVDDLAVQKMPLEDSILSGPSEGQKICKDLCGNGSCEQIVCMAVGCPCPESKESCPPDCKE